MHIFTPKGSMHFFTMGVVRPWPRLPREAVATPSLAVLKARLDGALRNLISGRCPCPWQRGWNWMIFKIPSNTNHSTIPCYCQPPGFRQRLLQLCILVHGSEICRRPRRLCPEARGVCALRCPALQVRGVVPEHHSRLCREQANIQPRVLAQAH